MPALRRLAPGWPPPPTRCQAAVPQHLRAAAQLSAAQMLRCRLLELNLLPAPAQACPVLCCCLPQAVPTATHPSLLEERVCPCHWPAAYSAAAAAATHWVQGAPPAAGSARMDRRGYRLATRVLHSRLHTRLHKLHRMPICQATPCAPSNLQPSRHQPEFYPTNVPAERGTVAAPELAMVVPEWPPPPLAGLLVQSPGASPGLGPLLCCFCFCWRQQTCSGIEGSLPTPLPRREKTRCLWTCPTCKKHPQMPSVKRSAQQF